MNTYTANDLYDMFANQADPIAIAATSTQALAQDIEELDTDGVISDYAAAARDLRYIAIQNLSVAVLAESEYGDPANSLTEWLLAGEYDGSETVEQIAAEWDAVGTSNIIGPPGACSNPGKEMLSCSKLTA